MLDDWHQGSEDKYGIFFKQMPALIKPSNPCQYGQQMLKESEEEDKDEAVEEEEEKNIHNLLT